MLTLQLFGGCALVSNGEAISGPAAQRRRLALLALLASSHGTRVSRDKLVAYFWPDDDRDRARHFLSDSLSTLRKSLGKDLLLTTADDVRLNVDVVDVDVARFEKLAAAGDLAGAVAVYRGPFLDGFFVSDAPEFERWAETERDRLARRQAWCLEQLAGQSEMAGDWASAAEWWRVLAAHDPYSSRVALRAMRALEATGDTGGALQHARTHEARVREELGLESDPAVLALAEQLRARPTAASRRPSMPPPKPSPPPITPEVPTEPPALDVAPMAAALASRTPARRLTPRVAVLAAVVITVAVTSLLGVWPREARAPVTATTPSPLDDSGGSIPPSKAVPRPRRDEARDLYTQGRYILTRGQFDPTIHRRALALFQQSAERDSTFAPAYAGMADVYNHADDYVRAKQAALKALSLDDSLAEAHTALSYVLAFYEYKWDAADSALQRALALNPRYVLAHLRRANVLAVQGRIDEATAEVERAGEIQPESFLVLLNRATIELIAGDLDEAINHLQAAHVLEPSRYDAQYMLAHAYWSIGRYAEAEGVMRSVGNAAGIAAMSGNRDTMARLAPVYAASVDIDSIRTAARLYARLGMPSHAFAQLDRLFERRDKFLAAALRQHNFVSLRRDSRYRRLLSRMRLK